MGDIAIITDSCAEFPPGVPERYGIIVLSHTIRIGAMDYVEGQGVSKEALRAALRSEGRAVTSAVNPDTFLRTYENTIGRGGQVMAVCLPPRFSCTLQNAHIARDMCSRPDAIHIFDSKAIGAGLGRLVVTAAQLAGQGAAVAQIRAELDSLRQKMYMALWLGDLSAILQGGRVASILSRYRPTLGIHPILTLAPDGAPKLHRLTRTMAHGIDHLTEMIVARGWPPGEVLGISHYDNPDGAIRLQQRIQGRLGDVPTEILEGGNLLYVHFGAGSLMFSI